ISQKEVNTLKREIFETAQQPDIRIDPGELTSAVEKIVEKTGDLDLARKNMRNIGLAIQATGAAGQDIGAMVADLQQKFGLKDKDEFLRALDTLTAQGKEGAFTLQNLATEGEGVTAAYAAMGRTGPEAVREMGALLQVFKGGTKSSAEAATTFVAVMRELVAKADDLKDLGVEVWDPDQLALGKKISRSVPQILTELIKATEGDISQLSKIFGEEAAKGVKVLINQYQQAGKLDFDKFLRVQADGKMLLEDAARVAGTFNASMRSLYTTWQAFADAKLEGPVKSLSDLAASLKPEQIQKFLTVATYGAGGLAAAVVGRKLGLVKAAGAIFRRVSRKGSLARAGGRDSRPFGALGRLGVQPVEVVNWPAGGLLGAAGPGTPGDIRTTRRWAKSVGKLSRAAGALAKFAVGPALIMAAQSQVTDEERRQFAEAQGRVPAMLDQAEARASGTDRGHIQAARERAEQYTTGLAWLGQGAGSGHDWAGRKKFTPRYPGETPEMRRLYEQARPASPVTKEIPVNVTVNLTNNVGVSGQEELIQCLRSGQGQLADEIKRAVNDGVKQAERGSFAATH
ncbi:MAG: phage tail tape measure protein, partial [Deltaproteobacteria bacterium]|nr:phage tail tape measure protein [Deltaproteobacteria bacterium]